MDGLRAGGAAARRGVVPLAHVPVTRHRAGSPQAVAVALPSEPDASADRIRKTTGLTLTDEQFVAMIGKNRRQFKLVHFVKRDHEGARILPGRPGVRLRPAVD
jgi:hypothetical protein